MTPQENVLLIYPQQTRIVAVIIYLVTVTTVIVVVTIQIVVVTIAIHHNILFAEATLTKSLVGATMQFSPC